MKFRMVISTVITAIFILAICVVPLLCINKDSRPVSEPVVQMPANYRIVVDEETLVQYIQWNDSPDYPSASRTGGMTVRVKEDGTPYTIDRKDLDKYEHFMFNKKGE